MCVCYTEVVNAGRLMGSLMSMLGIAGITDHSAAYLWWWVFAICSQCPKLIQKGKEKHRRRG